MIGRELFDVFLTAVGPPLAIATLGYLLGRWREVDSESLGAVTIYLLLPALVFHSLVTMPIGGDTALSLVAAMVGFTAILAAVTVVVARVAGETGSVLSGATLAAAFPNVGNFGLPVATFAFGEVGRTTAVLFVLVQNVLLYTLGVYYLSKSDGSAGRASGVKRVLKLPVTYAVVAAGVVIAFDLAPPTTGPTMQSIKLMGDASIPLFLIILGLQIADMRPGQTIRRVLPTAGVKLLIAPFVAGAIAFVVGFGDTVAGHAFVVLAAGPAAVTPLVLTIEFTDDSAKGVSASEYVGTVILLTIFGSLPVVSGLILLFETGL